MSRHYAEVLKAKGEEAANQMLFDESRRLSLVFRKHRDFAASRGSPRSTASRSAAASS